MMPDRVRILIVDDEPDISSALLPSLLLDGYEVLTAENATQGIELVREQAPQLMILDLGLPDIDGQEVIKRVRDWSDLPIIVLSARHLEHEKVTALDLGANDYVNKPFAVGELLARMRVALRLRQSGRRELPTFQSRDVLIDYSFRRVLVRGNEIHLTPKEFRILQMLAQHADQVVTHNQLLEAAWNSHERRDSQTLRVTIKNIRQKIELDPHQPVIIITESGIGYRLRSGEVGS